MNNNCDELHPNWRALATIHLPLKRFIRAGEEARNNGDKDDSTKYEINAGESGLEVKQFYDAVLQEESGSITGDKPTTSKRASTKHKREQKPVATRLSPFDANMCFRCAVQNNVKYLEAMELNVVNINSCDDFGWTALMMAACEGSYDAVEFLLRRGANAELKDKSGKTALDLARRKGHSKIVETLEKPKNSKTPQSSKEVPKTSKVKNSKSPFYCDTCKQTFKETTEREHLTSTVHQFNAKPSQFEHTLSKFNIPQRNPGLKLMVKQGWNKESGLGPTQNGRLYPVKTVIRKQRTGLGIDQEPARVTHFDAYDTRATERRQPYHKQSKKRSRNDMRSEKTREWKRERRLRNELS